MNSFLLIFNTVKYLKLKQVFYRVFYFLKLEYKKRTSFDYSYSKRSSSNPLYLVDSISHFSSVVNANFSILNLEKNFDGLIDWNYGGYGKLWNYNLNYFEYLKEKKDVYMLRDFVNNVRNVKFGMDPFPISLRGMNWIKFLSKYEINESALNDNLYAQYYILMLNLEYHLLGNHLLENGFSLLFGAYYFEDEKLYKEARKILLPELEEQVLVDGGHFELSPMYHQLMLFRILDCINLIKNNAYKNLELLDFLVNKASLMLGWLDNITYKCGRIPLFNDSANGVAPSSIMLFDYANRLGVPVNRVPLGASGYRKFINDNFECVVDVGSIGAEYIPGHAHSDTFNFELYVNNKPFIIDTGLSTYNQGQLRDYERSTSAHNTVEINSENSSEVWSGFRVADRAEVFNLKEGSDFIQASHNGYKKKFGILHSRRWEFEKNRIIIKDKLSRSSNAIARFHFAPGVSIEDVEKRFKLLGCSYAFKNGYCSLEFNKKASIVILEIYFEEELFVEITL